MNEFTEQELVRRGKMEDIRAKGIDPFGERFDRTHNSLEIKTIYADKTNEELEANPAIPLPRLVIIRPATFTSTGFASNSSLVLSA